MLDFWVEPFQPHPPSVMRAKGQVEISKEIQKLVEKESVRKVSHQEDQFLSRIFTVPKKDGSCRLVVNLRPLNHFITKVKFKMEGMAMLKSILQKGDWMVSIDLKDAYLSVPVRMEDGSI